MRIKMSLVAVVLALTPGWALAMGCEHGNQQAMSCAEGLVWDHDAGECVEQVSS